MRIAFWLLPALVAVGGFMVKVVTWHNMERGRWK